MGTTVVLVCNFTGEVLSFERLIYFATVTNGWSVRRSTGSSVGRQSRSRDNDLILCTSIVLADTFGLGLRRGRVAWIVIGVRGCVRCISIVTLAMFGIWVVCFVLAVAGSPDRSVTLSIWQLCVQVVIEQVNYRYHSLRLPFFSWERWM